MIGIHDGNHRWAGILADTTTKLANAPPHITYNSSARTRKLGKKLFPLFVLDTNHDVIPVPKNLEWEDEEYMTYLGRPLWRNAAAKNYLYSFARDKLIQWSDDWARNYVFADWYLLESDISSSRHDDWKSHGQSCCCGQQ